MPSEKFVLETDGHKLKRVLQILISNAIQYSPKYGKIKVTLEQKNGQVLFEVKDSGIGIRKEDLPNIFTKFFRTDEARHLAPDGLGLGLFIAKSYIEGMAGKIGVKSEGLGRGSTFWFILPAK